ncbi:MAG: SMC-Scp complex subunit ScpB, partial [Calditrichia bacterium]|nr:SMC-Scp complex subunit ScpB [Calditrichia bacterium]
MELRHKNIIESLLFVSAKPIKIREIINVINEDEITEKAIKAIIDALNSEYEKDSKPFYIKNVANGYRLSICYIFYIKRF